MSKSATLLILGEDLDPGEVSRRLEMVPDQFWKAGEPKARSPGTLHGWGGWKCFGSDEEGEIEAKVDFWLKRLVGKGGAFRWMREQGWTCSIDCFQSDGSDGVLFVDHEVSERLADLGLDLRLSYQMS